MSISIFFLLLIIGFASGILSGLFGLGGGLIIVPALVYFLAFSQKQAQGTSLGVLLLPVGILAVLKYYKDGFIDVRFVLLLSAGFLIGGYYGSKLALTLSDAVLKKVFAVVLLIVALKILFLEKENSKEKTTQVSQSNCKTKS